MQFAIHTYTIMNSFYVFILLALLPVVWSQPNMDSKNFGPYKMVWKKIELCKGPKQKDCGENSITNKDKMTEVKFFLNITTDCPISGGKIMVNMKQSDNSTKNLWNHVLSKPCQHFVLGPVLADALGVPISTCKVTKGEYHPELNLKEKSEMFLGTSFFYGSYRFKITINNKHNNFFCFISEIDIVKK